MPTICHLVIWANIIAGRRMFFALEGSWTILSTSNVPTKQFAEESKSASSFPCNLYSKEHLVWVKGILYSEWSECLGRGDVKYKCRIIHASSDRLFISNSIHLSHLWSNTATKTYTVSWYLQETGCEIKRSDIFKKQAVIPKG